MFNKPKSRSDTVNIADLLGARMAQHDAAAAQINRRLTITVKLDEARKFIEDYQHNPVAFKPGDLVVWKPGMKNTTIPAYDEAIMVLEVFSDIRDVNDSGMPDGMEPYNMRCLTKHGEYGKTAPDDCPWQIYAFDSNRFKLYTN